MPDDSPTPAPDDDQNGGGPASDWKSIHLWHIQPVRDVLVVIVALALLQIGYAISIVTVPLLLAIAFAYLFEPVVARLVRVSWINRQIAAGVIIAFCAVVIMGPILIGAAVGLNQGVQLIGGVVDHVQAVKTSVEAPQDESLREALPGEFWKQTRDYLVERRDEGTDIIVGATNWLSRNGEEFVRSMLPTAYQTGRAAVRGVLGLLGSASILVFMAFLTAFFFFFVSTSFSAVLAFFRKLIPSSHRDRVVELASKMDLVIAGFVRGRLTIALIQAALLSILYWLIGVPAPLLIGPIVGFVSIIPYVGQVGIPISIILMWIEPSSVEWQTNWWWVVGAPIAVFFLVQALDDYVFTPAIQGQYTNMDTPTILFAAIAGGALAGIYGLLIAIPVAACIKILIIELIWPRFQEWIEGSASDPLPIGGDQKKKKS